jgi:hypothetical protein
MYLGRGFPCVVALGITFPFEEILQFLLFPKVAMVSYRFHLVFVFSYRDVGRWSGEVRTVVICFDIWGKKRSVEYRVNVPLEWECELIRHW